MQASIKISLQHSNYMNNAPFHSNFKLPHTLHYHYIYTKSVQVESAFLLKNEVIAKTRHYLNFHLYTTNPNFEIRNANKLYIFNYFNS